VNRLGGPGSEKKGEREMKEFSVKAKLWSLVAIMLLCLMLVGGESYLTLDRAGRLLQNLMGEDVAFINLAQQAHLKLIELRRYEKDFFLNIGDPEPQREYLEKYQEIAATIPPRLNRLAAMAQMDEHLTPEIRDKVATLAGHFTAYREGFAATVQSLTADPTLTPQEANHLMITYKANIPILEDDMTAVVAAGNQMLATVSAQAIERGRQTRWFIAAVIVSAILLAGILGTALSHSIYRSIFREGLRRMAHRI
jgi:methyl-accepting chemotaxis protein